MKRFVALAVLAAVVIVAACSNQAEGEVCNIENGNDDCETTQGLLCFAAGQLNNVISDRCCPDDRSRATHPACVTAVAVGGVNDAQAPSNTGPAVTTADATVKEPAPSADATAPGQQ